MHLFILKAFVSLLALYQVVEGANEKYVDREVQIEILFRPSNCTVKSKNGDMVDTDYIGTFPDGVKFDSTYDRNKTMSYRLGDGSVIKGCEIGTENMCAGEKRRIIIPPHLAYGDKDYGQIPAGSTLHFDIVLLTLIPDPFASFASFGYK